MIEPSYRGDVGATPDRSQPRLRRTGRPLTRLTGWLTRIGVIVAVACVMARPGAQAAEQPATAPAAAEATADQPPDLTDNETCLGCHSTHAMASPRADGTPRELFVPKDEFNKSLHGRMLQCVNCHAKITEIPHKNIAKTIGEWRSDIPRICATCHPTQLAEYLTSVHGKEVTEKHNTRAAVCSDCHSAHTIERPAEASARLAITKGCGNCHEKNLKSYLSTYHGQVTTLGYGNTAKCFDCHGSHAIQRVKDPASTVHPNNRLATCRKCHANATAGFVTFEPHATSNDFARYPYTWAASKFMLLLLGGTFAFFWTHCVFWYIREFLDHRAQKKRPHVVAEAVANGQPKQYYQRWPAIWRIAHLGFAITVISLLLTGMTLLYADTFWAPAVQRIFGGPTVTGLVHRFFAVAFVAIFVTHIIYVVFRVAPIWRTFDWFGPYSLVPSLQDLRDAIGMFKWFFGLGPRPVFDKWTYWEKFDYWAPFWGVTIIGVSGAMLWFKELTATYLPGWVFNVATIFHGEEAFLAAGFLFTVHFFNNHWRPDKFPLDIVMFTGVMPLEEFRREHTVEYDRLVRSGELKNYLVDAPSRPMTLGSKILGFTLMAAGLILLVLILIGFVGDLRAG